MVRSGYLQMAEVPGIPVLPKAPAPVAYGPVADAAFAPDVVVIAARPASAMLIYRSGRKGGRGRCFDKRIGTPRVRRLCRLPYSPGTTAISFVMQGQPNLYPACPMKELYIAIPGAKWGAAVLSALEAIVTANETMGAHYRAHDAAVRGIADPTLLAIAAALFITTTANAATRSFDVVVYECTKTKRRGSRAVTAAREGLSTALIEPTAHVGGMVSSGLGFTDYGKKEVIGGYAREFYARIGKRYGKDIEWLHEPACRRGSISRHAG